MIRRRLPAFALAFLLVVTGGCSSKDDGEKKENKEKGSATTAAPAAPVVTLTVNGVDANATAGPDEATVAAVKATVDGWIATGVVAPLATGAPAGDLSPFFTAPALERLADPAARAALVDEGLPPASAAVAPEVATMGLASVAGPDGVVAVIVARIDLKVRATGPSLDIDVVHQGELVLVPDAGTWKIDSFTVHTTRDSRA